jgi:hypothetical protein
MTAALIACVVAAGAAHAGIVERLSERGPTTPVVGALFALTAPIGAVVSASSGASPRLAGCRFGHGLKMLATGAVILPVGLVLAPFNLGRIPAGWMDGVVDAFQEDYCSRPAASLLP